MSVPLAQNRNRTEIFWGGFETYTGCVCSQKGMFESQNQTEN